MMGHDAREARRVRAAQEAFTQQLRTGDLAPLDRFGSPIQVGSTVLFHSAIDQLFRVVDVKPILDPRMPAGLVAMTLQTQLTLPVQVGQPLPVFLVLQVAPAAGTSGDQKPAEPPAGEPPSPPLYGPDNRVLGFPTAASPDHEPEAV